MILDGQINIFDIKKEYSDMEIIGKLGDSYWKFFKKYMVTFNMILDIQINSFSKDRYEKFVLAQWGGEYQENLTKEQIDLFYELSLNRIERILKIDMDKFR